VFWASRYGLRESAPAAGRGAHMKRTWRHTKFPDRSRLVHTAASRRPALSSGEANGWLLAKDLRNKKGHARDMYFLLQTRNFGHFSAPSSLFTCCYLLASAFHRVDFLQFRVIFLDCT
jgi:hypothetical protein